MYTNDGGMFNRQLQSVAARAHQQMHYNMAILNNAEDDSSLRSRTLAPSPLMAQFSLEEFKRNNLDIYLI